MHMYLFIHFAFNVHPSAVCVVCGGDNSMKARCALRTPSCSVLCRVCAFGGNMVMDSHYETIELQ